MCREVENGVELLCENLKSAEKEDSERQKKDKAAIRKVTECERKMFEFDQGFPNPEAAKEANLEKALMVLEEELHGVTLKVIQLNVDKRSAESELSAISRRVQRMELDKQGLVDMRTSRMSYLERHKPHIFKAVEFFSQPDNRSQLIGKIYDPMILSMRVDKVEYGAMVERHIGTDKLTSFFCENKQDLRTVIELLKTRGLRVPIIHHDPPKEPGQPLERILPDAWKRLGFHTTLLDQIKAPPYYLSFLLKSNLHEVPIGSSPQTDEKLQDIRDSEHPLVTTFYTNRYFYHMRKAKYSEEICSNIEILGKARIFSAEINDDAKEQLAKESAQEDWLRREVTERIDNYDKELARWDVLVKEKTEQVDKVRGRVDTKRQIVSALNAARRVKDGLNQNVSDLQEHRENSTASVLGERLKSIDNLETYVNKLKHFSEIERRLVLSRSQHCALQRRIKAITWQLTALQASIEQHSSQVNTQSTKVASLAAEVHQLKDEASKSRSASPPEEIETLQIDDLNSKIMQAEIEHDLLPDIDPLVVQNYEERKKKIEGLLDDQKLANLKLVDVKKMLEETKKDWLDPVTSLIARVNHNFGGFLRSLGGAGEVQLCHAKDRNDYFNYGIKILVTFRTSESLVEMCGNRVSTFQSGGERVTTTALYVLALQELSVVPFRILDEINQGMDSKNESKFFHLLQSLSQGEGTPQYFLLSPKMLPAVEYPDNAVIHFILNGPNVEVSGNVCDLEDNAVDD